jgi:hypothetical protein
MPGAILTNVASIDGDPPPFGGGTSGLVQPGTLVKPPSIAGGGWAFVNNTSAPFATAADVAYGIQLTIPGGSAPPANCGLVQAIPGSDPTASIAVGASAWNARTIGDAGPQQMWTGCFMYESATDKYLSWMISYLESSGNNDSTYVYVIGTGVEANATGGMFTPWSTPFVRMRLSGADILCELSLDLVTWLTVTTVAITTAFTTGPDHYGFPLKAPLNGGTCVMPVYHCVLT